MPQQIACKNGEFVNMRITKRQSSTIDKTTIKAEDVVQSYLVQIAYIVHPDTTASVIRAAINTNEFPDCIPVAAQMKLTMYDSAKVNATVNIIFCGYLRPPSQQNIQIWHTTHTTIAKKNKAMFQIWNLKKLRLVIDNIVMSTVTSTWQPKIVQTLWMKSVLAAPYKSEALEGSWG